MFNRRGNEFVCVNHLNFLRMLFSLNISLIFLLNSQADVLMRQIKFRRGLRGSLLGISVELKGFWENLESNRWFLRHWKLKKLFTIKIKLLVSRKCPKSRTFLSNVWFSWKFSVKIHEKSLKRGWRVVNFSFFSKFLSNRPKSNKIRTIFYYAWTKSFQK